MLGDATLYRDQTLDRGLPAAPDEQGAAWCGLLYWTAPGPRRLPGPDQVAAGVPPRQAWVHEGRWVIYCPCHGAQFACRTDHRHFCPDCCNADAGGAWVPVTWPEDAGEIERLLLARPDVKTRNWRPPETAADLAAENVEHGIEA